jgi:hypothetical protein
VSSTQTIIARERILGCSPALVAIPSVTGGDIESHHVANLEKRQRAFLHSFLDSAFADIVAPRDGVFIYQLLFSYFRCSHKQFFVWLCSIGRTADGNRMAG